ncbi:MAG: histidinol-phosphate transaminase [Candidatus Marinimicrobia bacterium]|nr:histidinol-phosphate transaminase [Candidatus Neomarinimicrobiota bacterium]MBL7010891.1 histidinol-phosphate transaminase [Candidatus Neomarinimicrobiota bacterium]MBL7030280.1 histidinol-phosphate transaminase [Candidatus Neomarinimicrobiota bacterium]
MALVPSYIQNLAHYTPGKPIAEAQRELGIQEFIKLASNENPLGPSPKGMEAIENSLTNLHRYPDATGYELRTKLADRFNIKIENVVLGAGSEGIMSTIMRTFLLSDDEIISAANSFIGFKVLANASGRRIHWVPMKHYHYDLEAMADKITDYTKIIYIANPDNPMGTTITRQEFDEFYTHVPERVLIILDEAYYEFAQKSHDYPDSMNYRYDNVITLRTFSKAYGLAGIRIGYGFAHESLIGNLMKVKVPFEPSLAAQAAGKAALDDNVFLKNTLDLNKNGMAFLKKEFDTLGIEHVSSATNFITTVWESEERASRLTQALLEKGIIVRQLTGFGWPNCIRISIGLENENQKCIESLCQVL